MSRIVRFDTSYAKRGRFTSRLPATERVEMELTDCGYRIDPLFGEDDDADNAFRGRNPNAEADLVEMICGSRY